MTIHTVVDATHHIAVQKVVGELKADEVLEAQRRLYLDPDHDPDMPVLWDSREGHVSSVAYEEMKRMAAESKEFWGYMGRGKTAIVTKDEADYGMGRMYQSLAEQMPRSLRVFREYSDAVAWLLETDTIAEQKKEGTE